MNRYDKAEKVREALHLWAMLENKNVTDPNLQKQRRKYHNQVLRLFEELIEVFPSTSASESKGGEVSIFAEVRGVNTPKQRK